MKVLVPLNSAEYLDKFVEAGADELYLGFYDEKWFHQFGEYCDINRMSGFKQNANRYDFTQMIARIAGHTECDIQPCYSSEYPSPVTRPAYSVLDKRTIK